MHHSGWLVGWLTVIIDLLHIDCWRTTGGRSLSQVSNTITASDGERNAEMALLAAQAARLCVLHKRHKTEL